MGLEPCIAGRAVSRASFSAGGGRSVYAGHCFFSAKRGRRRDGFSECPKHIFNCRRYADFLRFEHSRFGAGSGKADRVLRRMADGSMQRGNLSTIKSDRIFKGETLLMNEVNQIPTEAARLAAIDRRCGHIIALAGVLVGQARSLQREAREVFDGCETKNVAVAGPDLGAAFMEDFK
jgi:hypothetical protein